VLTPHPGEAARLLNMTTADIESDRFSAVRKLQQKYGGIAVLKGAGSLIRSPVQVALATVGNPGMASGGMGDVLSGMLGSLCAQGVPLYDAACLAVCWHGESADKIALRKGFISLSATDVIAGLGEVISPYEMAACERRN
jgi:NAD(P)H-hydrate epimerase